MIGFGKRYTKEQIQFYIVLDAALSILMSISLYYSLKTDHAAWAALEAGLLSLSVYDMIRGTVMLRFLKELE